MMGAYPYAGGTHASGVWDIATSSQDATSVAVQAITAAYQDDPNDPINVFTVSGGSQAFADALSQLPQNIRNDIGNVVYLIPGNALNTLPPAYSGTTTIVAGTKTDRFIPSGGVPADATIVYSTCGHSVDCVLTQQASLIKSNSGKACSHPKNFSRPAPPAPHLRAGAAMGRHLPIRLS